MGYVLVIVTYFTEYSRNHIKKTLTPPPTVEEKVWWRSPLSCMAQKHTVHTCPLDGCAGKSAYTQSRAVCKAVCSGAVQTDTLDQRKRKSWACRIGKSLWVELRRARVSIAGKIAPVIWHSDPWLYKAPSMGLMCHTTHLLVDMQQTSPTMQNY